MASHFDVGRSTAELAKAAGWDVHYHAEIPSTNTWAKQKSDEFKKPSLVITSLQTAGRGRGTHHWSDVQAGANLLSSWVLPLHLAPSHLAVPRAGLAVYRALRASFSAQEFALKAPNDVYVGGKKLAGLLLENVQQGTNNCLVIGLGLNVQSAPVLEGPIQATALNVGEAEFKLFLEALMQQWGELEKILNGSHSAAQHGLLNLREQEELLYALNKLNLPEPYSEVLPDASLRKASLLVHWQSL